MKVTTTVVKTLLMGLVSLVWVLNCPHVAMADTYASSAHGNTGYGVNRQGVVLDPDHPDAYDIGECAHCHDTFNDTYCGVNDLMLFSTPIYTQQNTGFCVECHKSPDNSAQVTMPNQRSYSYKFGGGTDNCPGHIKQAFNFVKEGGNSRPDICSSDNGSAHHLTSIRDFLQGRWGFGDVLAEINPCEGCHDKHKAQQHDYPVGSDGTSPISLPSTHDSTWEIWGDQTTERMDSYAGALTYQAPDYYYNAGGYEPEGNNTYDGSNLPDYVTFCTDCHNSSTTIYSNELDRDLYMFDWATEKHGRAEASDGGDYYDLRSPYSDTESGSYVMSCMDCHEPHGAANSFLTRKWVNGWSAVLTEASLNDWRSWCRRCHNKMGHFPGPHSSIFSGPYCASTCHPGGGTYNCYSPTVGCHSHGSGVGGL